MSRNLLAPLALVLALGLAACGGDAPPPPADTTTTPPAATTTTTPPADTMAPAEPVTPAT